MNKLAILALLFATPAMAQSPYGHTHYGEPLTISCLQGGQVIIQYAYATNVDYTWSTGQVTIEFTDNVAGQPRRMVFNPQSMSCLLEPVGQASVPVKKRQ